MICDGSSNFEMAILGTSIHQSLIERVFMELEAVLPCHSSKEPLLRLYFKSGISVTQLRSQGETLMFRD